MSNGYAVVYDRVTEYAHKVVSGNVVAGELHILACKRHLNDLEKQRTDEFPYYYDPVKAQEIIDYAETLTIAEGTEPRPVRLIDSQAFDLGVTFGWFKVSNNKRRFRRRYKCMARQNGKTFENGIMGTYIAGFGGYLYGKLFTVATKKRQARLAWEEMAKFIAEGRFYEPNANQIRLFIGDAESLYNAGYRKQSEGAWKKVSEKYPRYVCTVCNHLYNNKEYKYCPNCGAKMNGGAK